MTGYPPKKARALPAPRPRPHLTLTLTLTLALTLTPRWTSPRVPPGRLPSAGRLDPWLCRSPRAHMMKHWCTDRCAQIQISAAAGSVHCRSAGAFPCGPCPRRAALRASRCSSTCCCSQPCSTSTCSPPCWRPQRWRRRRPRSASSASSAGRARYRDRATGTVRDRSASLLGLYRDPYTGP